MIMKHAVLICMLLVSKVIIAREARQPIIDMHLHALHADDQGPPPVAICAPYVTFPTRDARWDAQKYAAEFTQRPDCPRPLWSAKTDEELMRKSLEVMARRNITGVASGPADLVAKWREIGEKRIIPAIAFSVKDQTAPSIEQLRRMIKSGEVAVIGEVWSQYDGVSPDDPAFEPYLALAEELDVPVALHMGPGPPGVAYLDPAIGKYKARDSNPLLLENVLLRHPKLRIYVMHAGWPMIEEMIAMLYAHPQLYVDVGVIDYVLPRSEFFQYLRRLVGAGFGKRVMFGSDQMVWPEAIEKAIEGIEKAPFLSAAQKRDILYNNAVRFLRLDEKSR